MMTVVTTMRLKSGATSDLDAVIGERFRSAHQREGWVSGQLLSPVDSPGTRVIIGTWRSREDWVAWHDDPAFQATRDDLEELQERGHETQWYDVVEDVRSEGR